MHCCARLLCASRGTFAQAERADAGKTSPLTRKYKKGEVVAYKMQAINRGHTSTVRYEADAKGKVSRDLDGNFVEEFAWTALAFSGKAVPLTVESEQFRQELSLSPRYKLSIPNLGGYSRA